jgi:hypothetical protein
MFDINENHTKTQINNLWNHLDELAEKNPEEYKNFISQQLKNGTDRMKNLNKDQNLKVQTFNCLRFKLLSIIKGKKENINIYDNINQNDMSEVPRILFSFQFESSIYSKKLMEDPKIYLNIVHSSEYLGPTDDNGNVLSEKEARDDSKWRYVPTLFRHSGKSSSMSGKVREFYDVIISSKVIEKMKSNEELKKSMLAYVVRKFCTFLNNKYIIFTENVKILETKRYKSLKALPDEFKIQPNLKDNSSSNIESSSVKVKEEPIIENKFLEKKESNGQSQVQPHPKAQEESESKSEPFTASKNFMEENKIIIPGLSENYPNSNTFYNLPPKNVNKNYKKSNPQNQVKNEQPKKILIEEIKQKIIINIKKNILSKNEMEIKFDFSNFDGELRMDNLDLQLSENAILLKLENTKYIENLDYSPIEMKFDFIVDVDKCIAKFNKIEKILNLILWKN